MKSYPSISGNHDYSNIFYVFDKLDGTNIRAEWSTKKGFYKFGTRNQLIDETNKQWGKSISLISEIEPEFRKIMKKFNVSSTVGFFEFHGPSSFAGQHDLNDEMKITLFDLSPDKKGLIEPRIFLEYFEDSKIDIPKLLYNGKIGSEFINSVKNDTLEGITFEGVVCKSINYKSPGLPFMFKIKTNKWLDKLKIYCKEDELKFKELV